MTAKEKMRTSWDVFHRIRWDEEYGDHDEIVIGYEDRIEGAMEMNFSAFVPMSEDGNMPFHRIRYFRNVNDDLPLWDSRRRLDRVFQSGDTQAILANLAGNIVKGFDKVADKNAAAETASSIKKAKATLARIEEERLEQLDKKRRAQARKNATKLKVRSLNATNPHPIADMCEHVDIQSFGSGAVAVDGPLRVATWNVLCDDHMEDGQPPALARAPSLIDALRDANPHVVALQEITDAVMDEFTAVWAQPFWMVRLPQDLAIASRHPISQAVNLHLGPAKRALIVQVIVGGRPMALATVHFTGDRRGDAQVDNSEKRREQAKLVRAALQQFAANIDTLICGDFNEPAVGAAVSCMQGLTDCWLAVHGEGGDAGYSFDPSRNNLASLGAINRDPRRLDRVFASSCLKPKAASLFGMEDGLSDHYGVLVDIERESILFSKPVVTSALAIVPPKTIWPQIQEIRKRYDPSFTRWMPHINLIYGFLPEEHFDSASLAAEKVTKVHAPIPIVLRRLAIFEHGKSASLVVLPDDSSIDAIVQLQAELVEMFPTCNEESLHAYQPHLTLGKFDSVEEARQAKSELEEAWVASTFVAADLAFLARSNDEPFSIPTVLPLGAAFNERDRDLLRMLESCTGARAFPVGSAALLGSARSTDSDFDILVVGTGHREVAFSALEQLDAEWSRRVDAKFPILQMQVGTSQLDIQYAMSSNPKHPLLWPDYTCDEGGQSVAALWDSHAVRSAILRVRGFQGWAQYQQALILVKKWAKARCINSNSVGFLGGFSWALLLANTALACDVAADDDRDGGALARAMWERFATWSWSQPVTLEHSTATSQGLMSILCPTDTRANSARNVTRSTFLTLQNDLQLIANGIRPACVLQEVLMSFPKFVCCEVRAAGSQRAVCLHWMEARLITLLRKLDDFGARPMKVDDGLWIIGIATEDLGISLVQRIVLSLLLTPAPYDLEQCNKYLQELDPTLELNQAALAGMIEQLSASPPCQHCALLESFGLDLLTHASSLTMDGPPSLERLTTRGGGPAVPGVVTGDWVDVLLRSSQMRTAACSSSFKKHSHGKGGVLQKEDTLAFCEEICRKLGVIVSPAKLTDAVDKVHSKNTGGMSFDSFSQFFERFLRQLSIQLPGPSSSSEESATGGYPMQQQQPHANEALAPVMTAVNDFRAMVQDGEWRGMIDITVEDAAVLQRRI